MSISSKQVIELLSNVKGCTFASIKYTTPVATSAANKARVIVKQTAANVQLFNGITAYKAVYLAAVKRSAAKTESNDVANIEQFELTPTWFTHSESLFSLVTHNKTSAEYLFCIYNNASSVYSIDGVEASKIEVAEFLTPSAAKALLEPGSTYNVKNDVMHNIIVRTISLGNINSIKAVGEVIS